jgi:uncharacterized protein YukE
MPQFLQHTQDVLNGLEQCNGYFGQAQQLNNSALETGIHLTSSAWQGESSQMYLRKFQEIHDELQTYINQGMQDVETTKGSVNTQSSNNQSL